MPERKLASWIEAFVKYTDKLPSPPLFRRWGAIAAVAGALERKVWMRSFGADLFPNLYVVLTGPAGVGKSVITSRVETLWKQLERHHVASADVTAASLMDELAAAERREVYEGLNMVTFNSLKIISNELSSLIPSYESSLMAVLTNIWDGFPYAQKRRTSKIEITMKHPQLNMLAATTPDYLNNVMPEGAWGQGFIARVLLIYSGQVILRNPLIEHATDEMDTLAHDLKIIGNMHGKVTMHPDAAGAFVEWHMAYGPPAPDHPKLQNYNIRRSAQLLKLCMIVCASESPSLEISLEHYQTALGWLLEAEEAMPELFKSMRSGGDNRVMEETYHFVKQLWVKTTKPVPAMRVYNFISERTPAHNVGRILDVMVRAGLLEERLEKEGKCYAPSAKS